MVVRWLFPPTTAAMAALAASLALLLPLAASGAEPAEQRLDFNEHIRPILSDRCYFCHGPDENHREAGLRLDRRDGATEDLGGGAAIVPGDPEASLLIERVLQADEDLLMPPPHSKRDRLSDAEVALLRRWIAAGAEFEPHWAFAPLSDQAPPEIHSAPLASNPIDRFVLARLEQAGIEPSPAADRATLIRRVYLDLTGLLPEPAEVAAFESDRRPDAYERLVDSLLASPHFAERWGRHWLDQARYADSNGYSIDSQRTMWPYRDWVIRAIGEDMPFDQFTREQLAGDLLPDASKQQRIASAFHRNTLINQEGGSDPEQFRHESVVDRVNTTGAVWLGLTLGCAQCHTHKFDPITHREYYELLAFFNSGTDVNNTGATLRVSHGEALGIPVSPAEQQRQQQQRQRETQLLQTLIEQQQSADESAASQPEWRSIAAPASSDQAQGDVEGQASLRLLEDGSLLVVGSPDANASYRLPIDPLALRSAALAATSAEQATSAEPSVQRIAAVKLRVLADDSLPKRGPGRAGNGNFVLTGLNLRLADQPIRPSSAVADHQQPGFPVTAAIDDDPKTGWAINVGPGSKAAMNADHQAIFVFDPPVEAPAGGALSVELHHQLNPGYLIGRFSLEVSQTASESLPAAPDRELIAALRRLPLQRSAAEQKRVVEGLRQAFPAEAEQFLITEQFNLMVMADRAEPRQTFISIRGDFLRPDQEVGQLHPGGLSFVSPALPAAPGRNRIDLADWLVDEENALTPRVTVNRVWMRYFGRGLVETEEDFGAQGTPPTHPGLLDWLARRFQRQGFSMKSLHRLIVTSNTYRQASDHRVELVDIDPRNELLARQNRIRFEAEIVRDAALSASGRLDRSIGGPSVHPPQPDGVYSFTQNKKSWVADRGGNRYRRAMYTEFFRSAPHPLFTTFDAPDFQTVCTRRARSNTPLQALTVANDEAFVELARGMAQRVMRDLPTADDTARIEHAFRLALSRAATPAELGILTTFHDSLVASFGQDSSGEAAALIGSDSSAAPDDSSSPAAGADSAADAAAMVAVCRAIFNIDNFITRE